jgi:Uma2 family endonuclease
MVDTATKPATYTDIEALPKHLVGEILFGHLITHPRPVRRHGGAGSALGVAVGGPYQFGAGGPGGWVFIDEPELHLGPHVVVPDLAGWRRERITEPADKAFFEVAPDWVCEILSPSTEKYDKGDKRRIYALYGVDHLWHLDPRSKVLEVFARQEKSWLLTHTFIDEEEVNAPPFDQLTFSLGLLWPFDQPE